MKLRFSFWFCQNVTLWFSSCLCIVNTTRLTDLFWMYTPLVHHPKWDKIHTLSIQNTSMIWWMLCCGGWSLIDLWTSRIHYLLRMVWLNGADCRCRTGRGRSVSRFSTVFFFLSCLSKTYFVSLWFKEIEKYYPKATTKNFERSLLNWINLILKLIFWYKTKHFHRIQNFEISGFLAKEFVHRKMVAKYTSITL